MSWTDDETNDQQANNEELVQMILLNKERKVRIKVELRDEHDQPISLKSVINNLMEYIGDKFKNPETKNNNFVTQIYPLLANVLSTSLAGALDANLAAAVLTSNVVKDSFMMTMSLSFLLLQYIKQNNLSIHTIEEQLTEEQIEEWDTRVLISSIAGKASMLGIDLKQAIAVVWKHGNISIDQVCKALGYTVTEEELNELAGTFAGETKDGNSETN